MLVEKLHADLLTRVFAGLRWDYGYFYSGASYAWS